MAEAKSMIGHNNGPTIERGRTYRSYQWRRAQWVLPDAQYIADDADPHARAARSRAGHGL